MKYLLFAALFLLSCKTPLKNKKVNEAPKPIVGFNQIIVTDNGEVFTFKTNFKSTDSILYNCVKFKLNGLIIDTAFNAVGEVLEDRKALYLPEKTYWNLNNAKKDCP